MELNSLKYRNNEDIQILIVYLVVISGSLDFYNIILL